jgi:Hg(II)-responsive transcriptional regulator
VPAISFWLSGTLGPGLDLVLSYRVNNGGTRSSEVASRAGVNTQTLRYYERRGLLEVPPRSPSGYRAYGADAVAAIRFIKRAQAHGFSLDQIEELLHLADGRPEDCVAAGQLARTKMAELADKIAELQRMQRSLAELVATCDLPRTERRCPIIRALYSDGEADETRDPSHC